MSKAIESFVLGTTLLIMGFFAYPLIFVPLGAKLFPEFMEELVVFYDIYLKEIWGL